MGCQSAGSIDSEGLTPPVQHNARDRHIRAVEDSHEISKAIPTPSASQPSIACTAPLRSWRYAPTHSEAYTSLQHSPSIPIEILNRTPVSFHDQLGNISSILADITVRLTQLEAAQDVEDERIQPLSLDRRPQVIVGPICTGTVPGLSEDTHAVLTYIVQQPEVAGIDYFHLPGFVRLIFTSQITAQAFAERINNDRLVINRGLYALVLAR